MTWLITSCAAETLEAVDAAACRAWASGADAVELRIDTFEGNGADLAAYLASRRDRHWIVTCRSADEGGAFHGDSRQRVSALLTAARDSGAYVDFELADFERSANIRQKVLLAATRPGETQPRLLLSSHDFAGPVRNAASFIDRVRHAHPNAIGKIAYSARSSDESFAALDLMRSHGDAVVAIAMGEAGLITRVLARKLGAFGSFAALGADEETAPGQLSVHEMLRHYRWTSVDSQTRVFGVLGDPVAHSLSPRLFNRWFEEHGVNAVYLPIRISADAGSLDRFLDGCLARPWLDVGGFSVTLPHKGAALRWAGGAAESMARGIGAANTLVFRDGSACAYNTDCYAAVDSLAGALGCARTELNRFRFDVLGAGGVARGIVYGLREMGCDITVYARNAGQARRVADEFTIRAAPWHETGCRGGDVVVNCTPIGLWPDTAATPLAATALEGCRLVFDLIYNPPRTRLLRDAAERGIPTHGGLDMFIRQAAMQYELWIGGAPERASAEARLREELEHAS